MTSYPHSIATSDEDPPLTCSSEPQKPVVNCPAEDPQEDRRQIHIWIAPEEGERTYLWLDTEDDMAKLEDIGISNPVVIGQDKIGFQVIAFVPESMYPDLRGSEIPWIRQWEDPEIFQERGTIWVYSSKN